MAETPKPSHSAWQDAGAFCAHLYEHCLLISDATEDFDVRLRHALVKYIQRDEILSVKENLQQNLVSALVQAQF
jgi:hypothetical protein